MHELRRMAYLEQLGIDSYVSRGQLPGAAPTRRLALRRAGRTQRELASSPPAANVPAGDTSRLPQLDLKPQVRRPAAPSPAPVSPAQQRGEQVRFSLSTVLAGSYMWLESLNGMPLAAEQVNLIRAMAHAVAMSQGAAGSALPAPELGRFDWPLHQNRQLDQSEDAARAGLAAFLQRRLEQGGCKGLVVLGNDAARWVEATALPLVVVQTVATAQMLADPACKVQVWRDLAPLRRAS